MHTHMRTCTHTCGVWLVRLSGGLPSTPPPPGHTGPRAASIHKKSKSPALFSIFLDDAVSMATKPPRPGQLSVI